MKRKAVSGITLALFLIGMLTLAFNIQPVKASGTIYIRADGSIEGTTDISTVDNVTYTFTDNIYDEIIVEKDNIMVDGAGYTVQGTGSGTGIYLSGKNNVTIKNIAIKAFERGLYLVYSSNNTITGNNITENVRGIHLYPSSGNNTIAENNITDNSNEGVLISSFSNDNTIVGNNIANNEDGVILLGSSNNVFRDNNFVGNRFNFGVGGGIGIGEQLRYFIHDVDDSNKVDGKPVYYLLNQKDLVINSSTHPAVGYLALVNCLNLKVEGLTLTNNLQGLLLAKTNNSRITNNNITNNSKGIGLHSSSNNTIAGNNITNNGGGIGLEDSSNNSISENNVINNSKRGIQLTYSSSNVISGNRMTNNSDCVYLEGSLDNTIADNNITNNDYGIYLNWSSENNTIAGNRITDNKDCGICFNRYSGSTSSNSTFYHNTLINNTRQVYDYSQFFPTVPPSINIWDDGYPSGGNYWSDYIDVDQYSGPYQNETGSDLIWDHPYVIDENNQDNYPIVPEFPSFLILPLFMITTLLSVIVYRRKHSI